jgi:hypothetical protein
VSRPRRGSLAAIAGAWRNFRDAHRQHAVGADRSRRMDATPGSNDGTRLTRAQMVRALREGAEHGADSGAVPGTGRPGAGDGAVGEHGRRGNGPSDATLRHVGASVTLAMLVAGTLIGARITEIPAESAHLAHAGNGRNGSIPGTPGPSEGDAVSSHPSTKDTNQEQQKMFSKIAGVTAAIAVGASVTVAGAQNAAVQWKVSEGGNGHWYQINSLANRPTSSTARAMAAMQGGHLITLVTQAENDFIKGLLCHMPNTDVSAWQGLQYSGGSWIWDSGEPFVFSSWAPGQPDFLPWQSCGTVGPVAGDCDHLWWGNEGCESGNMPNGLFVEWDADCNHDGIVDYGQCHDGSLRDDNGNNVPDCCEQGTSCAVTRFVPAQFPSIQAAVDSASDGDRIMVAPGTYREQVNLRGKGIQLMSAEGPGSTIIDGEDARTVIVGAGEPATCSITGFTIQHGFSSGYNVGGGIQLSNSSVRLISCRITSNRVTGYAWWSGGGAYTVGGAPTFEDCDFEGNEVAPTENIHAASALYHYVGGSLVVRGCRFHGNVTRSAGGTYQPQAGQQVKVQSEFQATGALFERCAFYDNRSAGALPVELAHVAISESSISSSFLGCTFIGGGTTDRFTFWVGGGQDNRVTDSTICGFRQISNSGGSTIAITNTTISESCADCDNDLVADPLQIFDDPRTDSNRNGFLDVCEHITDCNNDGIDDQSQVARGQLPDYDGNGVPDCCDRGEACVVGSYPVQWRVSDGGNGHWYQARIWASPKTWPEALTGAREVGALLACITSAGENDWIAAHSDLHQPGCASGCDGWHIGGYQDFTAPDYSEPAGGWRWISGEPWSYTAWLTGVPGGDRPNNYGPGGEQYLKMSELPYAPRWDDVGTGNENTLCGAILEWSADCNNDGIVDYGQILRGELADINHNGIPDMCECIGDIYVDGAVNGADLGALLAYWGPVTSAAASRACDLNADGVVNGSDLGILLAYWGPCPH